MPRRILPLVLLGLTSVVLVGCGGPSASSRVEEGQRPQRFSAVESLNHFAGDWGPRSGYYANDWIVRFTRDGRVSVRGPGMVARGTYVANDRLAEASYTARDGSVPGDGLGHGSFSVSPDNRELIFSTGLPNDPPVRLERIK